jgi:hypothetical protein
MFVGYRLWLFISAVSAAFACGISTAVAQDGASAGARCNVPAAAVRADTAIVTLNQQKSWQPRSGDVDFSLAAPKALPPETTFQVCFGWQVYGQTTTEFIPARQVRLLSTIVEGGRNIYKLSAVVPALPHAPPRFPSTSETGAAPPGGVYTAFMIVPVADLRVLAYDAANKLILDERVALGVTSRTLAAAVAVVVIFFGLAVCCWALPKLPAGIRVNPLLRLISTGNGYASLSQFQIILWTFLVGGAAAYVMALSGDLIVISTGTLVLLGISGAVVLGAQAKNAADEKAAAANAPSPPVPAQRAAPRTPLWSDLIASADEPIDVTRLQMLFFTLIAAAFVAMKVVVSYAIPEIPTEFLTLIGISNGVYMGSKLARPS